MAWDFLISPIVGAIGGIATQVVSYKSKKLDLADKDKQRVHDLEMSKTRHSQALAMTEREQAGAERKAVIEGNQKIVLGDVSTLGKSIDSLPTWSGLKPDDGPGLRWFKTIIEALSTLVRVVITLYFSYVLADLLSTLLPAIVGAEVKFTDEQISNFHTLVFRAFLEIAGLAIGFWFGSRGAQLKQQMDLPARAK